MMYDEATRARLRAHEFDHGWLRDHLSVERRRTELLGEIREAVFGAQDGLVSTLIVVSAVGGATGSAFPVLVAGFASALAGVFSMGIGEYTSSKSQREIYDWLVQDERNEVEERPEEAEAEVAFLLEQEGLPRDVALRVAKDMATSREVLLKTMVEKEHGIAVAQERGPLHGAIVMGVSFGLGSIAPILPYLLLPVRMAIPVSIAITALVLFGVGVVKSRWTHRSPLLSGLEIVALATVAAIAGYFFGSMLPTIFGVEVPAG
jgi:predicted membrane protein (TIGR00267 family)